MLGPRTPPTPSRPFSRTAPPPDRPKFRSFFHSPLLSLGGLFGSVGFAHDSPRAPNAHFRQGFVLQKTHQNSTRPPRVRKKIVAGEGKKSEIFFGPPTLRCLTLRCPTFWGSHPSFPVPSGPPPLGPHHSRFGLIFFLSRLCFSCPVAFFMSQHPGLGHSHWKQA